MTPEEFRAWVERQGTQQRAADLLGVRQSRISEWATGKRAVPPYIVAHLRTLGVTKP